MRFLLSIILLISTAYGQNVVHSKGAARNQPTRQNTAPKANAGQDKSIQLPTNAVTFFGSGTDLESGIAKYEWLQISGPSSATLTGDNTATLLAGNLIQGTYIFILTVTDDKQATGTDTVIVNVISALNIKPVANAGIDSIVTLPVTTCTLIGSGIDSDGTIVSYRWTKLPLSPAGGDMDDTTATTVNLTNLQWGVYNYQLRVTDNAGAVGYDVVTITVKQSLTPSTADGSFTFTLAETSHTSAGVFRKDSTLVRTLWSDVVYSAGSHTKYWDGKNDQGVLINFADSEYVIKVLDNNLQFHWDGTIGNSSDSMTGEHKHRGYYHCMKGLCFTSTRGYFVTGYTEGSSSIGYFDIATPNKKEVLLANATNGQTGDLRFVATDDNYVYVGAADGGANNNSFVFALNASGNTEVPFSSGSPYQLTNGKRYDYAISKFNKSNSIITGLAVQKNGNFLFVSRAGANLVQVLNKTTGALLQSLTYTAPGSLAVDSCDNLWMVTNTNVITKSSVSGTGTLTQLLTVINATEPIAIQVSADGQTLAVADAARTVQQLKFYSTATGALTNTFGTVGGYTADATVNNNKFYFNDTRISHRRDKASFIAYQSNGSYWVSDPGNFRVQHYNSSNVFINRIQSLGSTYRTWVDKNNITRLFSDQLEFQIDYSVSDLTGTAGWVQTKNWGANVLRSVDTAVGTKFDFVDRTPTSFPNGKTFKLMRRFNTTTLEVVELVEGGTLRYTGSTRPILGTIIAKDGSLHTYTKGAIGGRGIYRRYPHTGYDGSGTPTWNTTPDIVQSTPILVVDDPNFSPLSTETISSSNKILFYNPNAYQTFVTKNNPLNVPYKSYMLNNMSLGGINWLGKTEHVTHVRYQGEYPSVGDFEIGNVFAGSNINVVKRFVLTGHHDEFWKAMQTNKYNLYWDNLLAIGQFGKTRTEIGGLGVHAAEGMAGNALSPCLVESVTGDTLNLYHGDESDHSGITRWRITNLSSLSQQEILIKFPSAYVAPTIDYVDLMAGLPFDDTLKNNTAGWTRSSNERYINQYSNYYNVSTSRLLYKKLENPDLKIQFVNNAVKRDSVTRTFTPGVITNDWRITGSLAFPSNATNGTPALGINSQMFLDVLDDAGKILSRFYITRIVSPTLHANIMGNTSIIATGLGTTLLDSMDVIRPFSVVGLASSITITYGGYTGVTTTKFDASADWSKPSAIRVLNISTNLSTGVYTNVIDLQNLRFYKDIL